MKKTIFLFFAGCLFLSSVTQMTAQPAAPSGPPKVMMIFREDVKVGRGAAHNRHEENWPRAFARAKYPFYYLALTSVTGPNEAWFIEGLDSIAAVEQAEHAIEKNAALRTEVERLGAQDSEYISNLRTIVALYRDDLSYRAASVQVPKMRYVDVGIVRVRPGRAFDFAEVEKTIIAGHEKSKVDEAWAAYEVISGMPDGTFLFFTPMKSLKEADAVPETHKAYRESLGEEGRKRIRQMQSEMILTSEGNIFAFNPKMSYVSKEFASGDPDFWAPKRPAAPAKKEGTKPAGGQ